jgi:Uma2 family endonuclease
LGAAFEPMTLADFLAWQEGQQERFEFDGCRPRSMADVTDRHDVIGNNLRALLLERLRGKRCRVSGPTLKIEVAGRIRCPAAYIHCERVSPSETVIRNPKVIFEILGPSSLGQEWAARLQEYQATESISRCFVIACDQVAASVFARAGRLWTVCDLANGDFLAMPEIGIEVPLAEIYRDSDLPMWSDRGGNAVEVPVDRRALDESLQRLIGEMIERARTKGHLTYEDLNAALPPDQNSSALIEEMMAMLSKAGINIVESGAED